MKLRGFFATVCLLLWEARAIAADAGFQEVQLSNPADEPITVGIWYPTEEPAREQRLGTLVQSVAAGAPVAGEHLPLIVISHGTGGWYGSHVDTALALARAGFVVAAPTHPGDNYQDQSRAAQIRRRPPQLQRVVDYMLAGARPHRPRAHRRVRLFCRGVHGPGGHWRRARFHPDQTTL
jgi:predicted dienelactone hydrolase